MSYGREWGDLTPIRRVLDSIADREERDREARGEGDQVVRALGQMYDELAAAVEVAAKTEPLSVKERAQRDGVTPAAIYKRHQRARRATSPGRRQRRAG